MVQLIRCAIAVAILGAAAAHTHAADLSDAQTQALNGVIAKLNQATDNYNLAAKTVGSSTQKPTGSKAKLAQIRLDSARKALPGIDAGLKGLPADNEQVAATRAKYITLVAHCNKLQAILDGESEPAPPPSEPKPDQSDKPAPPRTKPAPDKGVKLDYKQEEQLKNARFYLNELEGMNKKLAGWAARASAVKDKSTIQWAEAKGIGDLVAKAKTRVKYSGDALGKLPGNGRGVAEQAARRSILTEQLNTEIKKIEPIYNYVSKIANPASYPTLQQDLRKMRSLSSMYADKTVLDRDADTAAALIEQSADAWKEFQAFAKVYGPLSNQDSDWGKQARGAGLGFANNYKAFAAAVQAKRKTLPGQIEGHLAEAQKDADVAVQQKKPLFFTGGVQQKMDWARDKQKMLAVLDEAGAKATAAKIAAAEADIRKKQDSLRDDIIAANQLPPNRYAHPDRKAIEAKAVATWKQREPNAKILKIHIASENWKRKRIFWLRDGTITETDASHIQVQLIVQLDDKLAVNRPVNVTMDHMQNDQLKASRFDLDKETVKDLPPHRFYLLKNVK